MNIYEKVATIKDGKLITISERYDPKGLKKEHDIKDIPLHHFKVMAGVLCNILMVHLGKKLVNLIDEEGGLVGEKITFKDISGNYSIDMKTGNVNVSSFVTSLKQIKIEQTNKLHIDVLEDGSYKSSLLDNDGDEIVSVDFESDYDFEKFDTSNMDEVRLDN
jgi:hypothetical protein